MVVWNTAWYYLCEPFLIVKNQLDLKHFPPFARIFGCCHPGYVTGGTSELLIVCLDIQYIHVWVHVHVLVWVRVHVYICPCLPFPFTYLFNHVHPTNLFCNQQSARLQKLKWLNQVDFHFTAMKFLPTLHACFHVSSLSVWYTDMMVKKKDLSYVGDTYNACFSVLESTSEPPEKEIHIWHSQSISKISRRILSCRMRLPTSMV